MHDFTKPYNILSILLLITFAIILFTAYSLKESNENATMYAGVVFILLALYRIYSVYLKK